MTLDQAIISISTLAAGGCLLLGLFLLVARYHSVYRWLALFLIAAGVSRSGDVAAFFLEYSPTFSKTVGVAGESLLPALLLSFASSHLEGPGGLSRSTLARHGAWVLYGLVALWVVGGALNVLYGIDVDGGRLLDGFEVHPLGAVYELFMVFGLTVGMMRLEQLLGSLQDPVRYRLKWILLGVAALAGAELLQAAHSFALGRLTDNVVVLTSTATLLGLALVVAGLLRTRLRDVTSTLYVSPNIVHGSVTLLLVGAYLSLVGLAAGWVRDSGGLYGPGLGYATVFAGIVALIVLALSRTVRLGLKSFVARHFYRSTHDYRAKWREITEAFQMAASVESILNKSLEVLSRTFEARRISIWMAYDSDRRFHQVRSMNTITEPVSIPVDHPLIAELRRASEPLEVQRVVGIGDSVTEGFLETTQAALLVPLKVGEELIAFAALSQLPKNAVYTTDDKDLLHGIAHHAAVLLSHAALSEEQAAAVQLNALHQFSAFCLHDIKNLAARLSLVVQNAKVHGHDPLFQRSAMQTVERTVAKMHELISKLAAEPPKEEALRWVDLKSAIQETVASLNGDHNELQVDVVAEEGLIVRADPDQLQQVFLNLVLNARQASGVGDGIRITARLEGLMAHVDIVDRGTGMDASQLRRLFQPFKSTKEEGLGIGLYQCRRIIERLGGRFTVKSTVGEGTIASIELPVAPPSAVVPVRKMDGKHASA